MALVVCSVCEKKTEQGIFCGKCGAELENSDAVVFSDRGEAVVEISECEDLNLYFNASRVLMEDASMPFEFRILPEKDGLDHLKITVSNPQGMKVCGFLRRSLVSGKERQLAVDLQVPAGCRGVLIFTISVEYRNKGRNCCFECFWRAEVTPREVQAIHNLAIEINQTLTQGHAGDIGDMSLCGIEKLAHAGDWRAVLSELAKIPPRWKELVLEECAPPLDHADSLGDPPADAKVQKLTIELDGKLIHLLVGPQIQLGRNRECDISTRIFDEAGRMPREENLYISKYHCGFVHAGSSVRIQDGNLASGEAKQKVWINGKKLCGSQELSCGTDFQLSFGAPEMASRILSFSGRVLCSCAERHDSGPSGLLLKRNDSVPESYLIVFGRVSLESLGSEWSGWYVGCSRGGFFLGNDDSCCWLVPGRCETAGPNMLIVKSYSQWGM